MLLIGRLVQSSSLNSFSSICYCCATLALHAYSCYVAVGRYREAESRAWPGGGGPGGGSRAGTPVEVGTMLGLMVLSLVLMPLFCVTCIFKVGNLANDGAKLGRDHALGCASDTTKDCSTRSRGMRRVWKVACPVSQTIHLIAAFLVLLPETLLTSVEITSGYKSTGEAWRSELDFIFPADRAFYSELRSSVNNSAVAANASYLRLDSPPPHGPAGESAWPDRSSDVHVSVAFGSLCLALAAFLVRYASVFWYTNKPLAALFGLQLLAWALMSAASFCAFSTLYCVSCNRRLYPNATLSLRCGPVLVLYLIGSSVLLASTAAVFAYGWSYFLDKFEVVARHRHPESFAKRPPLSSTPDVGCQGYVPHVVAMASLVVSAACKGPLLYDQVSLMRLTGDEMLLAGIVCDVCYMVLWLALWLGLTLKQQWTFRIIDYVALRPPPPPSSQDSVPSSQLDRGDGAVVSTDSLTRHKRLSGAGRENFQQRFLEPGMAAAGTNSSCEEPCPSDLGTDESDGITSAAEMVLDLDGNTVPPNFRRSRSRRTGGQRVTFDESVRSRGSAEAAPCQQVSGSGHPAGQARGAAEEIAQLNVMADVHSSSGGATSSSSASTESGHGPAATRPKTIGGVGGENGGALSREYRNSIRSKCGELYSSTTDLAEDAPPAGGEPSPLEQLPTLMSSFRDKVRESSLAASTFRERERHMLEQFDYLDPQSGVREQHPQPAVLEDTVHTEKEKRRCVSVTDGGVNADVSQYTSDNLGAGDHTSGRYRPRSRSYDQSNAESNARPGISLVGGGPHVNSLSLPRSKTKGHNSSLSSDEGHRSSFSTSTHESSDLSLSLPPAMEDLQRARVRVGAGLDRRSFKDDYLQHHHHHFQHQNHQPQHQQQQQQHQHPDQPLHNAMVGGMRDHLVLNPRPLQVMLVGKAEIERRDSANYSLTSSQETSSNESEQGQGLCSQV